MKLLFKITLILGVISGSSSSIFAQPANNDFSNLSIKGIMQTPSWIGTSPSDIHWSDDNQYLYFQWNPENAPDDSLYRIRVPNGKPEKVSQKQIEALPSKVGKYSISRTHKTYEKNGDLFWMNCISGEIKQITETSEREHHPQLALGEDKIFFQKDSDVFSWEIATGKIKQHTAFRKGKKIDKDKAPKAEHKAWLQQEELKLIQVLKERNEKREIAEKKYRQTTPDRPTPYYYGNQQLQQLKISPDGSFITFQLVTPPSSVDRTAVPNYIRESGYTDDLFARPKVGSPTSAYEFAIYQVANDTVIKVSTEHIPGIRLIPEYLASQAMASQRTRSLETNDDKKPLREVAIFGPSWSDDGNHAVVEVRSMDFKDRWIMELDPNSGELKNLDHQHDEAWIGGPGISRWIGSMGAGGWMEDNHTYWFQSEASGYSHIYTVDVLTGKKTQLTQGEFEIYNPKLSLDEKHFYFTANKTHPGERHFYKMPSKGGKMVQLTSLPGNNAVTLSPDESRLAILNSTSNRPWELFLQENKQKAKPTQITHSLSEEFLSYPWREPEFITVPAADGAKVHGRLYRPKKAEEDGPAVIFVHGAGYLQNAHKWWSVYFREYMFHNFLVDHGYTVLDLDFRASAGYGRDWRTAVYRDMGGKDLSDQIDGANFLVDNYQVSPDRIGIYGGSYGGFITLMAMFKEPGIFQAGAALRPVTDWAHYNHEYTGSMLNVPYKDSLAYVRSSPIYHAEGLEGSLLICHGMIDTNVHFQDVVRLSQRLIELGKDNWEVAMYPMEGHGFKEPSSWTDEYKRIFKLFEENLK